MIQTISCIVPVQKKTIIHQAPKFKYWLVVVVVAVIWWCCCFTLCLGVRNFVSSLLIVLNQKGQKKKRLWVIVVSPSGEARSCRDGREIELDLPWEINACGTTREKEKKTSNSWPFLLEYLLLRVYRALKGFFLLFLQKRCPDVNMCQPGGGRIKLEREREKKKDPIYYLASPPLFFVGCCIQSP